MLDRYRKSGGFVQLLNVIETCGPTKREQFLKLIREEDPAWAHAIERKTLSVERIFSWPDEALAEVVGTLQELTIAIVLHGLDPQHGEALCRTLSHSQKRRVQDLRETNKPTANEVSTMMMKLITETRKLITEGRLRLEKFDPEMDVDDDIEEQLKKGMLRSLAAPSPSAEEGEETAAPALNFDMADHLGGGSGGDGEGNREELSALRKKVAAMGAENASLRQEVSKLRNKLEQIKKMAA